MYLMLHYMMVEQLVAEAAFMAANITRKDEIISF